MHGFLMADDVYESTVPHNSNDVHEAERQGDPNVAASSPGIPLRMKYSGVRLELLTLYMMVNGKACYFWF